MCNVSGPNGSTLNLTGAGSCVVNANQAGNANFSAAPQVQVTVNVMFVPPTIPQVFRNPFAIWIIPGGSKNQTP